MIWLREMLACAERRKPFVLVTVIEVIGSAPREVGARMVVTSRSMFDSIGGGNLEHEAMHQARNMLSDQESPRRRLEFFGLGVTMNQCCGGAVRVMYEKFSGQEAMCLYDRLYPPGRKRIEFLVSSLSDNGATAVLSTKHDWETVPEVVAEQTQRLLECFEPTSVLVKDGEDEWFLTRVDEQPTKVVVFGAGHVGKALIKLLQDLPFQIDWVDSRNNMFPAEIPVNTVAHQLECPQNIINVQPPSAYYVVMTHSHGLDYDICLKILRERRFGWLGLIGSNTKSQRFKKRMIEDGIDPFVLSRLVCPIGIESVRGKFPAVIALSTAAQLLQERQIALKQSQTVQNSIEPAQSTAG